MKTQTEQSEIKMLKVDISVVPLEYQMCSHGGDHCTFSVTHRVSVDFRAAGIIEFVGGEYCETCATEVAKRIQSSLPEDE